MTRLKDLQTQVRKCYQIVYFQFHKLITKVPYDNNFYCDEEDNSVAVDKQAVPRGYPEFQENQKKLKLFYQDWKCFSYLRPR